VRAAGWPISREERRLPDAQAKTVIWCAGMYASASTWTFNVARAVALAGGLNPGARFVQHWEEAESLEGDPGEHVIKSHDVDARARALLDARARCLIVSLRDPRDGLASLMTYQRHNFRQALQRLTPSVVICAELAGDARTLQLRYEDRFYETTETIARIAQHVGVALDAPASAAVFEAHRREAIERQVAERDRAGALSTYAGGGVDPDTHWHKHHVGRSGEIGRWRRRLNAAEADFATRLYQPFLRRFGYLD
jgi:hypothetical protein